MAKEKITRTCSIEGCDLRGLSKQGWCRKHWRRWKRRGGDPAVSQVYRRICRIDGCIKCVEGHELCTKHYTRWRRYGDPFYVHCNVGEGDTPEQRFWSKVAVTADDEKCWEWLGDPSAKWYGEFRVNHKRWGTHQYSWFLANGREPRLQILHKCDNPRCVNPKHLYEGTQQQNVQDMIDRNRHNRGEDVPNSKYVEGQIREVKQWLRDGLTCKEISRKNGMPRTTVSAIKFDRIWKHIVLNP